MLYCPKCLNSTISIKSKGVAFFLVNGKQQDSSRILYNIDKDPEIFHDDFYKALENFMKWYLNFKNRSPITKFSMYTNRFSCDSGCSFSGNTRFSVVNILISSDDIIKFINMAGKKYGIEVNLVSENIE